MMVILKHMNGATNWAPAEIEWDVPCELLAGGMPLHEVYRLAAQAACVVDLTDAAPESARTVLAQNTPTIVRAA